MERRKVYCVCRRAGGREARPGASDGIQTVPPWSRSAVEGKSARKDQEFEAGDRRSDVESFWYVFLSDGYQKKE